MNREKLIKFRGFLNTKVRARGPARFYMDIWADGEFSSPEMDCNTAACALGHATVLFPDEIRLVPSAYDGISIQYVHDEHLTGYGAAEHLFDLTPEDTHYIFNPASYCTMSLFGSCWFIDSRRAITVDHVIKHIDDILRDDGDHRH